MMGVTISIILKNLSIVFLLGNSSVGKEITSQRFFLILFLAVYPGLDFLALILEWGPESVSKAKQLEQKQLQKLLKL